MAMKEIFEQDELEQELREAGRKLCVVAFTSGNCGPCRVTTPCLEDMSLEMPDVVFRKIDVKKNDEILEQFQITGVPAFFFFKNCQLLFKFQGGNTDFLKKKVQELRFC
ncbi:thioredoxin-like isoform X2 [Mixophyes fleayi]|uniref:thioredoxin-like isoform X2 n=1 Tax=Mixophyes fleayi TaxID=3061075 RepID=UPI003F4E2CD3